MSTKPSKRQDPAEQRDQYRRHARPVLVKSDDQQSREQKQRAREPHEQLALENSDASAPISEGAQDDDARGDDQPGPYHARERA